MRRRQTKAEARSERRDTLRLEFVQEIADRAQFWARPARPDGTMGIGCPEATTEYRCEGVAFSLLAALDGCCGQNFSLKVWDEELGEWSVDITGGLHELFFTLEGHKGNTGWGDPAQLHDALSVMVLTPGIRKHLQETDPKALEQAVKALGWWNSPNRWDCQKMEVPKG